MKSSRRCICSGKQLSLLLLFLSCLLLLAGIPATTATAAEQEQAPVVTAEQTTASPSQELADSASLGLAILKAFGALAVVIGLLLLLAAGVRKLGLAGQAGRGAGIITVLDTKMIAPKKYVAVIDIAGQPVAVGITEQQITMLTRLEETETLKALATGQQPTTQTASRFAALLDRATGKATTVPKQDRS